MLRSKAIPPAPADLTRRFIADLIGLVKDEGKFLRVLSLDKDERIAREDVESRATMKVSVMPDGQEATMSRREFVDLIMYLQTLK